MASLFAEEFAYDGNNKNYSVIKLLNNSNVFIISKITTIKYRKYQKI